MEDVVATIKNNCGDKLYTAEGVDALPATTSFQTTYI